MYDLENTGVEVVAVEEHPSAELKYLRNATDRGGYCLKNQYACALIKALAVENQFEIEGFKFSRLLVDPIKKLVSYGITKISKPYNRPEEEHCHLTLLPNTGADGTEVLISNASALEMMDIRPETGPNGEDKGVYKLTSQPFYTALKGGDISRIESEFGQALDRIVERAAAIGASVTKP